MLYSFHFVISTSYEDQYGKLQWKVTSRNIRKKWWYRTFFQVEKNIEKDMKLFKCLKEKNIINQEPLRNHIFFSWTVQCSWKSEVEITFILIKIFSLKTTFLF